MAVIISCDVCDETFPQAMWEGMAMSIPNNLLGLPDEGEESYTICSWECVFNLARHQVDPEEAEEPVPYALTPAPRYETSEKGETTLEDAVAAFGLGDTNAGPIVLGTTPLEKRRQPSDETPLDGITKNRRNITLRREAQ